ncbi:MAG TPA: ABC transporter permease [Chthoniobacterales bacterium]|nr:ABC transporter permease [Chthoniobacterales bacterium]
MLGNFRLALRLLAKSRGFTLVAITTLAVTIGVNSAIFSLIDGALLRPAVPSKPNEVVGVFTASRDAKRTFRQFSYAEFLALRESNAVFSDVAAVNFNYVSLGRAAELQRSFAFMVSENYFRMMGVQPVAGRFFTADETRPNAGERVVVASYKLWQRSGGRPDFIGSTVLVNGRAHTVVGVSPESFSGVSALIAPDIWLPLGLFAENTAAFGERSRTGDLADPKNYCVNLMGRMRPGVTIASAQAQLPALAARLAPLDATGSPAPRDLVVAKPFGINTTPSDTGPLRLVGTLLLSMSGVVLLIGCLNLANMMLARGSARASEIAVRLALGATRIQIVRQLLMEGVVLATAGGFLGLLLSLWANSYLQNFFATEFASFNLTLTAELRPDFVVLAATFILCLLATLVFSLGPALRAARADLVHDLKGQAGDAAVAGRWNRFFSGRHLMVMGQIALCLVMLFAAGVFVRAAVKEGKQGAATGFSTEGVVIAELDFSLAATSHPEVLRRSLAAVERLRRMPGVESAALTSLVPYNSSITTTRLVRAEEAPAVNGPGARPVGAIGIYSAITPGYFDSIGVRLLRGRDFTEAEARNAAATRVCIIDERMAEKLFPGEDALGRRVRYAEPTAGGAGGEMEIIGIVARHAHGMEDRARPAPGVYVPLSQEPSSVLFLAVRAAARDRGALLETIGAYRRELQALDPDLPILQMVTFAKFLQKNFTLRMVELGAMIFGVFGGIALLLASVGVYGVKAYAVERRTREIGIRIALGASRRDVFALIMKQGAQQTAVALSAGLGLSLLAGNALAALFFQVRPNDPFVLLLSAAILTGATMLACFVPARRATRVSPLSALRSE